MKCDRKAESAVFVLSINFIRKIQRQKLLVKASVPEQPETCMINCVGVRHLCCCYPSSSLLFMMPKAHLFNPLATQVFRQPSSCG